MIIKCLEVLKGKDDLRKVLLYLIKRWLIIFSSWCIFVNINVSLLMSVLLYI